MAAGPGWTAQEAARILHALADATRRVILVRVLEREQSVSALARAHPISLPAVQKHVGVLFRAGLVRASHHGREQRVRPEQLRLRAAQAVRARYETMWRHRVAAMDAVLDGCGTDLKEQPCP